MKMEKNEKSITRDHFLTFQNLNSEDRNHQRKWDELELDVKKQFAEWAKEVSALEKAELKSWKEWEELSEEFLSLDLKNDKEIEKALKENADIGKALFNRKIKISDPGAKQKHPREIRLSMKKEFMEENRAAIDAIKRKRYESLKMAEKRIKFVARITQRINSNLHERFMGHKLMSEKYEKAKRGAFGPFCLGEYNDEILYKEIHIHEFQGVIQQFGIGGIKIESMKDLKLLLLHAKTLTEFENELVEAIEELKLREFDWKENYLRITLYGGEGREGYSIMAMSKGGGAMQLGDLDPGEGIKRDKKHSPQLGDLPIERKNE